MNIDHLRYFLVLSQEMHYSRAAQRLNISQSGLSHAIVTLEKELGVSLFQKSGRGIALGRFGEALLPQAQQIVALADSCLRNFQMLKDGVGTIRLQTIPLLVIPTVTRLCREKGMTVVLITHHMDEAAQADRVVVMSKGRIVADGAPREVFQNVEQLRAVGLTVPEPVALMWELRRAGLDAPLDVLSDEECAQALKSLLA